jgi:cell wall-associated NlpC family hydrolase
MRMLHACKVFLSGMAVLALLVACTTPTVRQRPGSSVSTSGPRMPLRAPNEAQSQAVAFRALSLVGTPYVYGGESPQTGFDCSGFVKYIYRDALQISLARTSAAQSQSGAKVWSLTQLRLGDLVFFAERGVVFHVGLYVGENRFVHAPRSGKNVELSSLNNVYWGPKFVFGRRVL